MLGIVAGSLKCEVEKAFEEESMQLVNNLQAVVKNEFSPSVRWAIFDLQAGVGWQFELVLPAFALGTGAVPTDGAARFHFHKTLIGPRVLVLGEVTPPATFLPHSLLVGWELEKPILE